MLVRLIHSVLLFGCAFAIAQDSPNFGFEDLEQAQRLREKVVNSHRNWLVLESIPEFDFALQIGYALTNSLPIKLRDGQEMMVLVIGEEYDVQERSVALPIDESGPDFEEMLIFPCPKFTLIYLQNFDGDLVDWKSVWLDPCYGALTTQVLDVNHDGLEDVVVICEKQHQPNTLVAAYSVWNERFEPVIREKHNPFPVEIKGTKYSNGLVVKPVDHGRRNWWRTDKLYKVPILIVNTSDEQRTIGDLRLNSLGSPTRVMYEPPDTVTLPANEGVFASVTLKYGKFVSADTLTFGIANGEDDKPEP